jgi:hypothetical protein
MRKRLSVACTLLMVLLMAATVPKFADAACVTPPSGLVSWWGGDNNALDIVGTNHGTLNRATYAPGKVSQAFSFDGTDGYVNVPYSSSLDLQGSLTITAWINSANNSSLNRGIAGKAGGYQIYVEAGGLLVFGFYNVSGGWTLLHSSILIPENAWVHVAGTFNSTDGTMQLYINGAPDTSLITAQRLSANANPVKVGGFGSDGAPFSGRIDEISIFNRALSASEIAAIYIADSEGMCRPSVAAPSGMVAWWPGNGNPNDVFGTNNGALQGSATYAAGKVGQAFSFDGNGDFVQVLNPQNIPAGNSPRTIVAWIKSVGDTGLYQGIVGYGLPNAGLGSGNSLFFEWGGDSVADKLFQMNLISGGASSSIMEHGTWYHVALTHDGSATSLYLDGVLESSVNMVQNTVLGSGTDLRIGNSPLFDTWHTYFYGFIDEPAIFNRALAVDEIAAIYNAGSSGMSPIDTTPDTFDLSAQTGMPISTAIVSNPITITGISYPTAISITGGEYSVSTNSGDTWSTYSSTIPATVSVNNQVKVRLTSSSSPSTLATATLTIGGVSGDFNVTTAAFGDPNASGLVSWWKAENNAYDSVVGNHGTPMNGATYGTGLVGKAFNFDGVNDYVAIPNSDSLNFGANQPMSLNLWVKRTSTWAVNTILAKRPDCGGQVHYILQWYETGNWFHFGSSGGLDNGVHTTADKLPLNSWTLISITFDGAVATMYINGAAEASHAMSFDPNTVPLILGGEPSCGDFFGGLIDEVKFYNRALSASEIATLYGLGPNAFTFSAATDVPLSTQVESNSITVSGITYPSTISITGGEYQINGGSWTVSAGAVNHGDTVKVHLTSSGSYFTTTTATLTIGGVNGTFSVTTLADSEKPVVTAFTLHTAVSSSMSVSVDSFTATDNDIVSGYLITDTAISPATDDPGWSATAPATVYLSTAGDNILRAWAKDPAGNVSEPLSATVQLKPVRRESANDYVSLQTACTEANSGETIKVLAVTLPENIDLNQPRDISISGGYEDGYGNQNGFTTIQGTLTVGRGSLTVERVIVK